MTTEEAKQKIEEAGKTWEDFQEYMFGETVGLYDDGTTNYYERDVDRFIRGLVQFG